ncbi:hypothetical protein OG985_38540 [Streptomyces sp. NBC_00289]|uniref:hypothetical protein n=1 Tax=Streptomyces sp. NBC_00289 TaxID=2975703 RepID=UPI0032536C08
MPVAGATPVHRRDGAVQPAGQRHPELVPRAGRPGIGRRAKGRSESADGGGPVPPL